MKTKRKMRLLIIFFLVYFFIKMKIWKYLFIILLLAFSMKSGKNGGDSEDENSEGNGSQVQ